MSGGSTTAQPSPGSTDPPRALADVTAPATTTTMENAATIQQSKESTTCPSRSPSQPLSSQTTSAAPPPIPNDVVDAPAPRRGSKRSFISRSRNVSRSSRRSARAARATEAIDPKEPVPLVPQQKASRSPKKPRSGFLAFLNCCSPSESLESLKDEAAVPAKKAIIQPAPAKTERLAEQTEIAAPEKEGRKEGRKADLDEKAGHDSIRDGEKAGFVANTDSEAGPGPQQLREDHSHNDNNPKNLSVSTNADAPLEPQTPSDQIAGPDVNIIAATPVTANEQKSAHDSDAQDVHMSDASGVDATQIDEPAIEVPVPSAEIQTQLPLPPPPPLNRRQDQAGTSEVPPLPEGAVDKQTWLLPPVQPHLQGRKCLILDLDETLVHSSFKILNQADFTIPVEIEGQYHNVYVIKRPGVDAFMKRVGELFEVVVFTASVSKYGDPLLDQLDIHHVVHHRLFRESCYNHQGNYVKDLSQVGRDVKETIIIDNSPTSYIFHPQHAVPISSWFSDAHDNELLDLIPVLEDLAGPQVTDVSLVLDVAL
ncbi:hypothetical protein DV736_g3292, partial [Chaetothyriales sp. CBS 134916]